MRADSSSGAFIASPPLHITTFLMPRSKNSQSSHPSLRTIRRNRVNPTNELQQTKRKSIKYTYPNSWYLIITALDLRRRCVRGGIYKTESGGRGKKSSVAMSGLGIELYSISKPYSRVSRMYKRNHTCNLVDQTRVPYVFVEGSLVYEATTIHNPILTR